MCAQQSSTLEGRAYFFALFLQKSQLARRTTACQLCLANGWWACLRLDGSLESYFAKAWRAGAIEGDGALVQGDKIVGHYNSVSGSFGLQAGVQ